MTNERYQHTLRNLCHVSGRGYWTGKPVTLTFLPAEPNTGILFRRVDLPGSPILSASVANRTDVPLRTRLVERETRVDMVEHVLAALFAYQIDNCVIEITGEELPGLDGSAFAYSCAFRQAGLRIQDALRNEIRIGEPIRVGDADQWIQAMPCDTPGLTLEYRLDYGPASSIRTATFSCEIDVHTFHHQIACARTFITSSEASLLQTQGLALHVTNRDLLVFSEHGPIDNSLRFSDECARHKLLDLLGDLALAGLDIHGKIVANRSGHRLNAKLAQCLLDMASLTKPERHAA